MKKTININGVDFEVLKPRNSVKPFKGNFGAPDEIYQCYDRPSRYKVGIWEDWYNWALATDGVRRFEITSYNCMQFTIRGLYEDENGDLYNLVITKMHNKAIKVYSND